jgi:oligopeptide/dipeptide ABC transporter ATP-binding protein
MTATTRPDPGPLLQVRALSVGFRARTGVSEVVHEIDLDVHRGETVGIVGESGSGKSVTALALARLHRPDAVQIRGSVSFDGIDLLGLSDKRIRRVRGTQLGFVFQNPLSSLNPVLTIERQMCEAARLHTEVSRQAARRDAVELLELVGISDAPRRLRQYPHELSGGMRQRVMIAAALMTRPKLLIADEPTTAVDVTVQAQILDLLRRLQSEFGMALILISHDLGVMAGLADRIAVMYAGRIVETGPAADVLARPRHPYTIGLVESVPRLDAARSRDLRPIPGVPLSPSADVRGCSFADRCGFVFDRCRQERPLLEGGASWAAACWLRAEAGLSRESSSVTEPT